MLPSSSRAGRPAERRPFRLPQLLWALGSAALLSAAALPAAASGGWTPPPPSLPPPPPDSTCVTIQRGLAGNVFDTDVSPGYGNWAAGNYPGLWTGLTNSLHWTLVEFDLSPIPPDAQIVLSTFSIYVGWDEEPGPVRAHRITTEWDEQTTSYANFGGTASWDPLVLASFDPMGYGYKSMDLTAITQGWYSGAIPAHGILLEEDPDDNHGYSSSESSTPGYRPRLDVCYISGGPCAGKQNGDSCDDGNTCTTGETCQSGQCTGGQPVTCNAQDVCHDAGICDPATGQCTNPVKPDGSACDDLNACTGIGVCMDGGCTAGVPVSCDDQSACTADTCDPQSGCQYTAVTCNDNSLCTTDTCDPATGCVFTAVVCNDGDACTNDACDPATGCTTSPVSCTDGVECTADSCAAGNCQHVVACPPGAPCSADFCTSPAGQDPQYAWISQSLTRRRKAAVKVGLLRRTSALPRPHVLGAARPRVCAALLASLAVLPLAPAPARAGDPEPAEASADPGAAARDVAQDIRVAFEGYLLDQTERKVVVRMSFELTGFEWIDTDGVLALELEPGRGKVRVTGPHGAERELDVTVRLTRFLGGKGPLARGAEGQRRWPLRGDLYVQARGEHLVELEMGGEIHLPPPGQSVRWAAPEKLPEGEGSSEAIGRVMLDVHRSGTGGGLLLGTAAWGRPAPPISYMGVAHIVRIETKASKRGAEERDADRLLGRLAYVRDDYARSVKDGVIINDAEYGEQVQLAREAQIIADRLKLTPELREKVGKVRLLVEWRKPPAEVAEACRAVSEELARALVFATTPPDPAPLEQARMLYAENCARCHGEAGDGKGPAAKDLDPPPRDFHDETFLPTLSPQRAFSAVSSGVAATGMPSFEALDARARWTLAFFVYGFRHREGAEEGRLALQKAAVGVPPLDDLAFATDADLAAQLARRLPADDVPAALAFLRTAGVDEAAQNPVTRVAAGVRRAVKGYSGDPAEAESALAAATAGLAACSDAIAARDERLAGAAETALADLASVVRARKSEDDVQAVARAALAALRPAEVAMGQPAPPPRSRAPLFVALAVLVLSLLALAGRKVSLRLKSSSGPSLREKTP